MLGLAQGIVEAIPVLIESLPAVIDALIGFVRRHSSNRGSHTGDCAGIGYDDNREHTSNCAGGCSSFRVSCAGASIHNYTDT